MIYFTTDDGIRLEGRFHGQKNGPAAVITHPHPLYGGDMDDYVVSAIEAVFRELDYTTLRFNFRGVGQSGGTYDEGNGEIQDVLAAIQYLWDFGANRIELAGYSFGTWVNARAAADTDAEIARMIMVSPPVTMLTFPDTEIPELKLILTGAHDDYSPPDQLRKLIPKWNPNALLEVIEGGDHFYGNAIPELRSLLKKHLGRL